MQDYGEKTISRGTWHCSVVGNAWMPASDDYWLARDGGTVCDSGDSNRTAIVQDVSILAASGGETR